MMMIRFFVFVAWSSCMMEIGIEVYGNILYNVTLFFFYTHNDDVDRLNFCDFLEILP